MAPEGPARDGWAEAHNCRGGEKEREDGCNKLVEADAGGARQQGAAAAEVHAAHLARQQTDPQHAQRPARTQYVISTERVRE